MGRKRIEVTPEMIKRVKKLLKNDSLSGVARETGITYYVVWKIANGKYGSKQSPKSEKDYFDRCPITGW